MRCCSLIPTSDQSASEVISLALYDVLVASELFSIMLIKADLSTNTQKHIF